MHWLYIYSGHPCAQLHLQDQMAHTSPPCKDMNTELFLEKGVPCIFFFCLLLHVFCPFFFYLPDPVSTQSSNCVFMCCLHLQWTRDMQLLWHCNDSSIEDTEQKKKSILGNRAVALLYSCNLQSSSTQNDYNYIKKTQLRYSYTSPFITKYISYDSQPFCFTFPQNLYQILGAYGTICMKNYYKLNMQKSLYFKMKVQ